MKRVLVLLALLAASNAHATKARLRALAQGGNGSYYITDTRNIFLNPAQITLMRDHFNAEWGKQPRTGVDTVAPDAEGGFVMPAGDGKLGAQLGRVSDFNNNIRLLNAWMGDLGTAVVGGNFPEGQNNVDIIYGAGGADMRWGGLLNISRSKNATGAGTEDSVQAFELRGGVHTDAWEGFGSLIIGAESESELGGGVTGSLEENFGLMAGGGFQIATDKRVYGNFRMDNFEASAGPNVGYDGTAMSILLGYANWRDLENNTRFFYALELNYIDIEADDEKATNVDEEYNAFLFPVTLGIEADANEWARLRASVRQNFLLGNRKSTEGTATGSNKWDNAPNDTAVSGGVGASLNKFNFDVSLVQSVTDDHGHAEVALTYIF